MKTIKLTENGVEIECYLIPVEKENLGKVTEYLNTVSTINKGDKLEIKPKFKVWRPKQGKPCYWIAGDSIEYCGYNKGEFKFLHFETHEQAKEFVEKMEFNYEVEMFIKEKNEGWEPDWGVNMNNYYLYADHYTDKPRIFIECFKSDRNTSNNKYFKSTQIGEEILAKFDNDKLLKYWI